MTARLDAFLSAATDQGLIIARGRTGRRVSATSPAGSGPPLAALARAHQLSVTSTNRTAGRIHDDIDDDIDAIIVKCDWWPSVDVHASTASVLQAWDARLAAGRGLPDVDADTGLAARLRATPGVSLADLVRELAPPATGRPAATPEDFQRANDWSDLARAFRWAVHAHFLPGPLATSPTVTGSTAILARLLEDQVHTDTVNLDSRLGYNGAFLHATLARAGLVTTARALDTPRTIPTAPAPRGRGR